RAAEYACSLLPLRRNSLIVFVVDLLLPTTGIGLAWSGDPSNSGLFTGIGGLDYIRFEGRLFKYTCSRPMTPKWSECPSNSHRELSLHENENKDGNVYKRRKMDKDSNSLVADEEVKELTIQSCTTSEDHSSLLLLVMNPSYPVFSNLTAGKIDPVVELEEPAGVSLEPNSGVNKRCSVSSMPPSSVILDKKDASVRSSSNIRPTESITELTSARDLCIAILRKDGLITESQTRIISEESTDCNANHLVTCNTCGSLDVPLKMLICDSCEAAFHLPCCIPCIKVVPAGEWYCQPCLKKKPKSLYGQLLEGKVRSSGNMDQRPHGMSHIEYMFKDAESYVTGVRLGGDFQAEVPEWSGPISSSDGYFTAPSEFDPAELMKLNFCSKNNHNKSSSSTGNWVQCREVLSTGDPNKPVICGKWRRAPLYVGQSDDWDCFCCLLWDPAHADCAVPQELDTDEVLKQLKYVNAVKNRLADRKHKPA
uniref:PHD-type domain-containing protein n=1 Tax=Aegilops tauschii subsp. strangulata TaxID=200361 RepID=A0A453HWQ9_AEGTS